MNFMRVGRAPERTRPNARRHLVLVLLHRGYPGIENSAAGCSIDRSMRPHATNKAAESHVFSPALRPDRIGAKDIPRRERSEHEDQEKHSRNDRIAAVVYANRSRMP